MIKGLYINDDLQGTNLFVVQGELHISSCSAPSFSSVLSSESSFLLVVTQLLEIEFFSETYANQVVEQVGTRKLEWYQV